MGIFMLTENYKMSLSSIANDFSNMLQSMQYNATFVSALILTALIIHIINCCFKNKLHLLGIIPRKAYGLPGLVFAPWLHGSFSHWFINSLFFFILASMALMLISQLAFVYLCLYISIGSGLLTWIFGRRAIHIGGSGVVMGLWGFLLMNAARNPSFMTVAIGVVVFYFLGNLVANIIPKNDKSSWEAHLFGALAGVTAFWLPGLMTPL
jgi:membrane associated rhomboid family serine protease